MKKKNDVIKCKHWYLYRNKVILGLFEMISECNYFCVGLNWWSIYHIWTGGQFTIPVLVVYFPYLDWWFIYHMWTGGLSTISWVVVYLPYLDWWSIYHTLSSGHFTTSRVSVFLSQNVVVNLQLDLKLSVILLHLECRSF